MNKASPRTSAKAWIDALVTGRHGDPFAVLGPHDEGRGTIVRTFAPGARSVDLLIDDDALVVTLDQMHPAGLFAARLAARPPRYRLRLHWSEDTQETEDPYAFAPLLSDDDVRLIHEGRHRRLADCLGAHVATVDGVNGVRFAVWAPNARRVSVIGDFNSWDGRRHPMRLRHDAGVWELFVPRLGPGARYKFELLDTHGHLLPHKADPLARAAEAPPATASIVTDPAPFAWSDDNWIAQRQSLHRVDQPLSIYEVHVGSWLRCGASADRVDWDFLAERLIPYAVAMGFTHIELLPIMEHPFGGSWGYQPLSLFAPSARYGTPARFAAFVDGCHRAGLGVILDWVPAHFPSDSHGLARFDGSALYEHADPREGYHRDWNTLIYNLGRREVVNFLIASACEWLGRYHIDGLRVDAVASMLYRDYSRVAGEWVPNVHGGRENYEAIEFLRRLARTMHERFPGAITVAEESTAWPGVTAPVEHGGLGFSYKWNMGWMNDSLRYLSRDPLYRRWHNDDLTFGLVYAFAERFVLPLSHDEVVHGKGSLIGRMPGDRWQKFAGLRAYFGFLWTHPGKKLLFMGGEIAQWHEWNHDGEVDWNALDDPLHRGMQHVVRDLNRLYRDRPALHARDASPDGFTWIVADDYENSVLAYLRRGSGDDVALVICNFTPVPRAGYRVGAPRTGRWREVFNSDAVFYGGSGDGNGGTVYAAPAPSHGQPASMTLRLPPLSCLVIVPEEV